jgi:hypothetical protein
MDVPARQAYVVAVVQPDERTAAAAYTNSARYAARPLPRSSPAPSSGVHPGSAFVIAGTLKAPDVAFWRMFDECRSPDAP